MKNDTAYINGNAEHEGALVVVFLRGGADGLTMVAPVEDDDYRRARPTLGLGKSSAVMLDDMFGLHPTLAPLESAYRDGDLALVHGVGSEDFTRSHFEAQDLMEHGGETGGGWLGRYLRFRPGTRAAAMAAVAIGATLPAVLRGAPASVVVDSFDDFRIGPESGAFLNALGELYAADTTPLGDAGEDALAALEKVAALDESAYRPSGGAAYPPGRFGRGLRQIAQLIKARVGLEAACIDLDGWDTHFGQAAVIPPLLTQLAEGLAALRTDLGPWMQTTSVVVMTEFGRRVYENASLGTDHGRAGVMFALGGGVHGGRVLTEWPGLDDEAREGPGDLAVTTNYRDVLAPVLRRHCPGVGLDAVFPAFPISPLALYA